MPSETHANTLWSDEEKVPVNVTVTGTGPFKIKQDGVHGTLVIVNADGTPALVTRTTDAVIGFQAATAEGGNIVFANTAAGKAIADEIVADANA